MGNLDCCTQSESMQQGRMVPEAFTKKVLLVGPDGVGKTTIIDQLILGKQFWKPAKSASGPKVSKKHYVIVVDGK